MFNKHLLIKEKNEEVLYLFIDYNYELSREFDGKNKREKEHSIYERVINYIKEKRINFKGSKVFLVVNGIIIGSLILGAAPYKDLKAEITPKYQYVEYLKDFGKPDINIGNKEEQKIVINVPAPSTEVKTPIPSKPATTTNTKTQSPIPSKSTTTGTKNNQNTTPAPVQTPAPTPPPPQPPPTPPTPVIIEKMVTLHRSSGIIEQISLEDYLVGVVGGEMPASFQNEALKAQAVAARTYALKRIDEGKVLYDTDASQVYKDTNQLKAIWGSSYDTYYNKVKNNVVATKGEYLTYNGNYIDALFFSTSNGITEDSKAVWGNSYPYLVSVDSHWDLSVSGFEQDKVSPITTIDSITGLNITDQSIFQVLSRTPGNRIDTISIDGTIFTGKQLRELLGLRSTDFDIRVEGDNMIFTTRGYGHGVGMSQYGANGMAKEGYSYGQILSHYYTGTRIEKIS